MRKLAGEVQEVESKGVKVKEVESGEKTRKKREVENFTGAFM